MPTFSSEAELPCTPERFWSLYLEDAWVLALFRDGLRFEAAEIVEVARDPFRRTVRCVPRVDLPGPVKAALGGRLAYVEQGSFDGTTFRWKVVVDALPERVRLDGTIRAVPTASGCRRLDEATIAVDLFGIRGAIERVFEGSTRDNWAAAAVYTRQWLAAHP